MNTCVAISIIIYIYWLCSTVPQQMNKQMQKFRTPISWFNISTQQIITKVKRYIVGKKQTRVLNWNSAQNVELVREQEKTPRNLFDSRLDSLQCRSITQLICVQR